MKKITFVEKDDNSTYDPVSTFFANANAKKTHSLSKPTTNTQISSNNNNKNVGQFQRQPAGKIATYNMNVINENKQKKIIIPNHDDYPINKEKPNNSKISRKGDHLPPRKLQPENIKQQQQLINQLQSTKGKSNIEVEPTLLTKKNLKNINKTEWQQKQADLLTCNRQLGNNKQDENNMKQGYCITGTFNQYVNVTKDRQYSLPNTQKQKESVSSSSQVMILKKKIKQLQQCSQQYIQRLQQFEEKQQKYSKMEQKYLKLQKQHKLCGDSKQISKKLMERQQQIKRLLSKDQTVYSKKRQILLQNQIASLKKINRELVTRIKNYKGTDLVQVSLQTNKCDILFKEYNHSIHLNEVGESSGENNNVEVSKIQSIAYRTIQQIQKYISNKSSVKQIPWIQDKKLLIQLNNYCKDLSVECLTRQFKVPSSNKQCINLYNEIQNYRHSLEPVISKHDLNFIITQENIEFINNKNEEISQNIEMRRGLTKMWNEQPKKFKKIGEASTYYFDKCRAQANLFQQNQNINNIILAHCIAQLSFMQSWINKMAAGLKQSLTNLDIRLKQMKQLTELGESGKQSLYLYITTNLNDLMIKIPKIQIKVKQIGAIFKNAKIVHKKQIK